MSLSSDQRLGSYEIRAPLGEGGMGEVHRAIDTKLGRDVTLRILPQEMSRLRTLYSRLRRPGNMRRRWHLLDVRGMSASRLSSSVRATIRRTARFTRIRGLPRSCAKWIHLRSNEASPQPPSDDEQSVRESSLLGGRCAAAKTASKAHRQKLASFRQNTALEDV